jgi:putative tryptophan/tyrosine transport system substrate-binding protein
MRRREFIAGLGCAAAWPLTARAQQAAIPVIGLLTGGGRDLGPGRAAFYRGLEDAGYVEGRTVAIEARMADGQYDRLPALAAELVRQQVAVIAVITPVAALAAKTATAAIPIVFSLGSDPVRDGLVASLNRPGGNVTGVTFFSNLLSSKRLQLLHQLAPNAARVALLINPNNTNADQESKETQTAARALGLQLIVVRAGTEREIDLAFASLVRQEAAAVLIASDLYLYSRRDQIAALAARHRLPTASTTREYAEAGLLMSYAGDRLDAGRMWGLYVGRVLKGEKPADLPVVQPTKFEFVINLKTAKALGLTIPETLLATADELIQ